MIQTVLLLLFCHWLGDFVFQNNWLANGKSKNLYILMLHALIYSYFIGLAAYIVKGNDIVVLDFIILNFFLHSITDYFTSRFNAKCWQENRFRAFFVNLGFDQLIHQSCLIATAWLFNISW